MRRAISRTRRRAWPAARSGGHPWWTLSQLSATSRRSSWTSGRRRRREGSSPTSTRSSRCCARTSRPADRRRRHPRHRHRAPRRRAAGRIRHPAAMLEPGAAPKPGVVGVLKGPLHDGVVLPGANLVVITETDLTGNRATAPEGKRLAAKRRNVVDPLALTAGDLVVHDQHGIGRFVEMVERTVGGARREYLVLEYASSKRGGGSDKLYRADGFAGPAVALRRRAGADAEPARRQRLDQHQDQGAPGGPRDRRRAGVAVRQAAGRRRATRSGRTPRGRPRWRTRSASPRPSTSSPRSPRSRPTWRSRSRWTG